jgi:predicted secreted hydrolase
MAGGLSTLVGAHPYLFANVLSLGICLGAALALRPQGRLILTGGLLSLPCFYLLAFFDDSYWNPVRIWDWRLGIEDALCAFDAGALALVPPALVLRNSLSWRRRSARTLRRFLLAGAAASALFLLLLSSGLGPMGALVASNLAMAVGLLCHRVRLWRLGLCGILGFPLLYCLIVRVYFLCWPGFITQWNPEGPWGSVLLGLPSGEIAWAVAFGGFWPLFVGYVLAVRVERSEQRVEGPARGALGAVRPKAGRADPEVPIKPWPFAFPRDHGLHPAFATEWWYLSGNLATPTGAEWGCQFAVFRHRPKLRLGRSLALAAPADGFASHLVITNCEHRAFRFSERLGSRVMGTARARPGDLDVRVREWSLRAAGGGMRLVARAPSCGVDLDLRPLKAPVLNGHRGISLKARIPEGASHHYSITSIDARGIVAWDDQRCEVRGTCWLDREFGSRIFPPIVEGWDWFSLRLDNGFDLMILRVRQAGTDALAAAHGTLVAPDGSPECLGEEDLRTHVTGSWPSPVSGARYPMGWRIQVPAHRAEFEVQPLVENHEINAEPFWRLDYWEGPVRVGGRMGDADVAGRGYVELTGYAQPIGGRF